MTPVMEEMQRCLDLWAATTCFCKTHRPEEKAKLAAADARLAELRAQYPASWKALCKRLGR